MNKTEIDPEGIDNKSLQDNCVNLVNNLVVYKMFKVIALINRRKKKAKNEKIIIEVKERNESS